MNTHRGWNARPLLIVLAVIGFAVTGPHSAFTSAQPLELSRLPGRSTSAPTPSGLRLADEAAQRADFARADELYRKAWTSLSDRSQAAAALRRLHRTPGFRLRSDETAIAAALAELGAGFVRRDTPHFVILSDCDLRWVQARADLLERTWSQFFRVAGRLRLDVFPPRYRLLCILFHKHDAYLSFATTRDGLRSPWFAGYYSAKGNRVVFFNEDSSPAIDEARQRLDQARLQVRDARDRAGQARRDGNAPLAEQLLATADELDARIREEERRLTAVATTASTTKTIHEAVHLLAFNTGAQHRDHDYPFWLSEGLATTFETDSPHAAFGPDRGASRARLARYGQLKSDGKLRPLTELITVSDPGNPDPAAVEALYCQAHALFAHLYTRDSASIGRYIMNLSAEPPGQLTPARHAELFRSCFGDAVDVEKRLGR